MEEYRGFYITHEDGHYRVTSIDVPWVTWTEDTKQDAHRAIDREWEDED